MASPTPVVMRPRRALPLGVVCLALTLSLLSAVALVAAGPASAAASTTSSASGQSVLALQAVQQAQLIAADGVWGSYFGSSVAIENCCGTSFSFSAYKKAQKADG